MKIDISKLKRISKKEAVNIHPSFCTTKGFFYKGYAVKEVYLGESNDSIYISEIVISNAKDNHFCYISGFEYDNILKANCNWIYEKPNFYSLNKTKEDAMKSALELQKIRTRTLMPKIVDRN